MSHVKGNSPFLFHRLRRLTNLPIRRRSMGYIRALACVVLAGGVSWATSPEARNAWLMKNYRFTGPPPPRMVSAADPAVAELQQVQSTLGSMIRRANLDGDYVTALDATAQSAFNAMQIGA